MIRDLLTELRRRHVYRVAVAYAVVGWLLIEVATQVFPVFHMPDWAAQLVVLLIALGFPIALVLAWAFEVTPDGVRRTEPVNSEVARAPEPHGKVGRTLNAVIMAVLVLALVLAVWRPWTRGTEASAPVASTASATSAAVPAKASSIQAMPHTIAVLPFANLSGDKSQQYFSDGISEDLLNLLARIPQLQVTARTSSFWFRGKGYTIPQIAEKLHVAYILEGSVQKAGDEVRISVQLVNAATDTQRWSQTYDRRLKDVFKIQDEIGADVVKQLKLRLLGSAPTVKPVDSRAYTFYLQGRLLSYQGTVKALDQSDALYRRALAIEPRYAAAWIGLAQNAINKPWFGGFNPQEGFGKAQRHVQKALAIEPDNAVALSVEGYLATFEKFDFSAAAGYFKRALTLDPDNPDVLLNVGKFLFVLGRPEQALVVLHRAKRLDPLNPDVDVNMAFVSIQQGRLKQAVDILRKAHKLSPENTQIQYAAAWVEIGMGQFDKALADFPNKQRPLPSILCAMGQRAKALKIMDAYLKQPGTRPTPAAASIYADCGDLDKAFANLAKTVSQRNRAIPYTVYGISFRKYHQDPRWKAYLRQIGFAPDQLAKVQFDVELPKLSGSPDSARSNE